MTTITTAQGKTVDLSRATWYDVPVGRRATPCDGADCNAMIYFAPNPNKPGKTMPIDCDVPGGRRPDAKRDPEQIDFLCSVEGETPEPQPGRGVLHFLTCPNADRF